MKYAIPLVGGKLSGHFGHCEEFAFFDVDETTGNILNRENLPSPQHQPGVLPAWLAEQGAAIIIAAGIGSRAQSIFSENNIKVITNVISEDPEKAVLDYINGTLTTGTDMCDH